jgi:hypothetical protein
MSVQFKAFRDPTSSLLSRLAAFAPENPFYTPEYVAALASRGVRPFALAIEEEGEAVAGCTAFASRGWLNRRLEITSLPELRDPPAFWNGLLRFCREERFSVLVANSFGSRRADLPPDVVSRTRGEYHLDLTADIWEGLNRNHRRQVKKAREAGLVVRRGFGVEACIDHARMAANSFQRRSSHGEIINVRIDPAESLAFLESGVGELYQVLDGDEVVSSLLILTAEKGAYGQTSGTSDAGLLCGASQFLWFEIAVSLRERGLELLNMGGADEAARGLREFKESFGARRIELATAELYLGSRLRQSIGTILHR